MKLEQDYAQSKYAGALLFYTDEMPWAPYAIDFFVCWYEPEEQYTMYFRERNPDGTPEDEPEAVHGAPWVFV